ncbi:MAG: Fic family protein [Arcobacteraceae bacterium]
MYVSPIIPISFDGIISKELRDKAEMICYKSAALTGGHSQILLDEIASTLRITNSYYSNLIESQGTHPLNIEKAMKQNFSQNEKNKNLQLLSLKHIEVQENIHNSTYKTPFDNEFIKNLHYSFYQDLPTSFLELENNGKTYKMLPGKYRDIDVVVGNHIAVPFKEVATAMSEFNKQYGNAINKSTKSESLLYALCSHHRFSWIHPFADGNGRISRLFLDGVLQSIGITGYELWNISRGLARSKTDYLKYLRMADMPPQTMTDGRGKLSVRGLEYFLNFMIDVCLDQIEYMGNNLKIVTLGKKIEKFIRLSQEGMLEREPLPAHSEKLLPMFLIKGEIKRSEIPGIIGMKERSATALTSSLLKMGYIQTNGPKEPFRLKLDSYIASYIFPNIFPNLDDE